MLSRWSCLPVVVVLAGCFYARESAAANRVARIDVEQSGPRRTVRIATTDTPMFATYALEDAHQVIIDIAEGDLRQLSGPLEIRDGVLGDVSLRQFQMGPLLVSRVTVALSVRCSTVVQAEGNAIVVHACHGAADIPTEPVLLASTEAMGVDAFTSLAEGAAALAALGPDLGDDARAMGRGLDDADDDGEAGFLAMAAGAIDPTEIQAGWLSDDASNAPAVASRMGQSDGSGAEPSEPQAGDPSIAQSGGPGAGPSEAQADDPSIAHSGGPGARPSEAQADDPSGEPGAVASARVSDIAAQAQDAAPRRPRGAKSRAALARLGRRAATHIQAAPTSPSMPRAMRATALRRARRAAKAQIAMAAARRRNAARLAKNQAILAMAERRFARRAAARVLAKERAAIAIATARPSRANRRAARQAARALLAARRAEASTRTALAKHAAPRGQTVADAGPMVIRGRRRGSEPADAPSDNVPVAVRGRRPSDSIAQAALDASTQTAGGAIIIQGRRTGHGASWRRHRSSLVAVQRVEKSQILLRVKGAGRIKSRHLADPPRFVVDLGGIRRDTDEKFFALDTDLRASRVRLGDQDFGVRAVFDLRDHRTLARVRQTKDGVLVAFSGRPAPTAQAPTRGKSRRATPVRTAQDDAETASQEEAMLDPQDAMDLQTQHDLQTAADLQAAQDAQEPQAPRTKVKAPRSDLPVLHPRGKSG